MKLLVPILLMLAACGPKTEAEKIVAATEGCRGRYDAIQRWIASRGRVPETPEELQAAAFNPDKDPWDRAYTIEEIDGRIIVWSAGPDGELGTDDDLSYPPTE